MVKLFFLLFSLELEKHLITLRVTNPIPLEGHQEKISLFFGHPLKNIIFAS